MTCDQCREPAHLFDAGAFMTRDQCGAWPGAWPGAWVAISVALAALYFAVAAVELYVWRANRRDPTFPRGFWWVAMFFLGCGGGHLLNALAFWWPAYLAFVVWDGFTLVASVFGLAALAAATRWQHRLTAEARGLRDAAAADLRATAADLEHRCQALERRVEASDAVVEIRAVLADLRRRKGL